MMPWAGDSHAPPVTPSGVMAAMDDATRAEIVQLREAGWTQAAIAAELGVSKGAVWRACQSGTAESAGDGRPPARRVDRTPQPQPGGLPVVLVVAAVAVIGGAWLWNWWRRRTRTIDADEPDELTSDPVPPWPASA